MEKLARKIPEKSGKMRKHQKNRKFKTDHCQRAQDSGEIPICRRGRKREAHGILEHVSSDAIVAMFTRVPRTPSVPVRSACSGEIARFVPGGFPLSGENGPFLPVRCLFSRALFALQKMLCELRESGVL